MKHWLALAIVPATFSCAHAYSNAVHEAQHITRSQDLQPSYDYVVVGGGTSGLTVADRLTESGQCK